MEYNPHSVQTDPQAGTIKSPGQITSVILHIQHKRKGRVRSHARTCQGPCDSYLAVPL